MFTSRTKLNTPHINVMAAAAMKAARGLIRDFNEVEHLQVSKKGPGDFVTEADHRAERILRNELEKARPDYGFLLEESGEIPGKDRRHRWVIDPLDGTNNFLHGVPHFVVSIGLQQDNKVIAGVVYDPVKDEMFCAEKGKGAYLNERRIRVSARKNLHEALIGTSSFLRGETDPALYQKMLLKVRSQVAGLREFGAAALDLCYIAAGRFDGYMAPYLQPWDVAAGWVILKEAGGYISKMDGRAMDMIPDVSVLASTDLLYDPLRRAIL